MKLNKFLILSLITVLVLSLFAGCRKVGDEASSNNSDVSSMVYDIVDVIEGENESTDSTVSEENTESDTTDGGSDTSNITMPDNIVDIDDGELEGEELPPTYIEETPETPSTDGNSTPSTKPTYATSPNATGKMKTAEIAAGQSVYYKIKGASNRILTIQSPNAYVIYNGVTYSASNGVLSFFVESDLLASDQILFEIGNKGSQNESFTIQFTSPVGSKDNPEVLNAIDEKITTNIKQDNDQGYSYSYVATKDGKIRFYILSDAKSGKITVDKIIDPKLQVIQQRSTDDTGEDYLKTDSLGTYIEFDVKSGDKFTITAAHNTSGGDFPAIAIEWKVVYA